MTSEAGKSLFRAANVWWRCAKYFVIVARCLETIDVCIWRMFVFKCLVCLLLCKEEGSSPVPLQLLRRGI